MLTQAALTDTLYTGTDDPGTATTHAVTRPETGDYPLQWYRDTKPRFYRPYMIRVVTRDDSTMEFVFLDARGGADLVLSQSTYKIAYHDGRYAYSALPSTAPRVNAGSTQSCGLLFISDLYMQDLPQADRSLILLTGNGEGKYPPSAGGAPEPPPAPKVDP
jgi:hypothetical protein